MQFTAINQQFTADQKKNVIDDKTFFLSYFMYTNYFILSLLYN